MFSIKQKSVEKLCSVLSKTGQNGTKLDRMRHIWTEWDKTGQNETKLDRMGQNWTEWDKTGQNRTKADIVPKEINL